MTHTLSPERQLRLKAIVRQLKRHYPVVKSELRYDTPIQFLAAVILSAQFTDVGVNRLTDILWKKYKTVDDFASATPEKFAQEIKSVSYFNGKARYIVQSARILRDVYGGAIPSEKEKLLLLPGVASKTANVVLGELYDIWDGIAVDTHVKRFVRKFDICTSTNATIVERTLCENIAKKDWKYINNGLVLYGRYVCKAHPHDCAGHLLTKLWPNAGTRWPKAG